jgi:hypothetical protein
LAIGLILLLVTSAFIRATETTSQVSSDPQQAALSQLSGSKLVRLLTDDASRPRVFYELWRRANPTRNRDFDEFMEAHDTPEVVVCPQGQGRAGQPIYLVLSGYCTKGRVAMGTATVEQN